MRGHEFKQLPKVQALDDEVLEERIQNLERARVRSDPTLVEQEERAAAAQEALLFLLGLIDSRADLKQLETGSEDLGLGGIYVEEQARIYLVRNAVAKERKTAEKVLAHELAHALDDQQFGLDLPRAVFSDRADAMQALGEGSASVVEAAYAQRYLGARPADRLLDLRERRERHQQAPPGLRPLLTFPYSDGADFVTALMKAGGQAAVDSAFRREPTTTEQILHPRKWIEGEGAVETKVPRAAAPGKGWRSLAGGDVGELSTRMLLSTALPAKQVVRAASGWGGGAYRTWYRGDLPALDCTRACRRAAVATLVWSWDTARDAAEFDAVLGRYVRDALGGRPTGDGRWAIRGGAAATIRRADRTALALAPDERLAGGVASRALQEER